PQKALGECATAELANQTILQTGNRVSARVDAKPCSARWSRPGACLEQPLEQGLPKSGNELCTDLVDPLQNGIRDIVLFRTARTRHSTKGRSHHGHPGQKRRRRYGPTGANAFASTELASFGMAKDDYVEEGARLAAAARNPAFSAALEAHLESALLRRAFDTMCPPLPNSITIYS
ncbi:conserved hypothetical protein, partial [Ricinus communis]